MSIQHCAAGDVHLLPAAAAAAVKEEQWKELQNLSGGAGQGRLSGGAGAGAGDFDDSDEGKVRWRGYDMSPSCPPYMWAGDWVRKGAASRECVVGCRELVVYSDEGKVCPVGCGYGGDGYVGEVG